MVPSPHKKQISLLMSHNRQFESQVFFSHVPSDLRVNPALHYEQDERYLQFSQFSTLHSENATI